MQDAEAPAPEAYSAYVASDGAECNAPGGILMVIRVDLNCLLCWHTQKKES